MSSDFDFTVISSFLGNVHIKPYFNTQCRGAMVSPDSGSQLTLSQSGGRSSPKDLKKDFKRIVRIWQEVVNI